MADHLDSKPPDTATILAVERTRVAYDRTMMAWIRTAISLLTFGFGIYKFFEIGTGHAQAGAHRIGPREFGLAMVSIGLISLLIAAVDNRKNLLGLETYAPVTHRSKATLLAVLIGFLCILALCVMLLRA
jgi:putative membrane protein